MVVRIIILLLVLLNTTIVIKAQSVQAILQKSYNKCQSIKNGYYEMTEYRKLMSFTDTTKSYSTCYFKKLKDHDLNLPAFRIDYSEIAFYNGSEFVDASSFDSTAIIYSKELWAKKIERESNRFSFFAPLTNEKYSIIQHDSDFNDKRYVFKLIGEEKLKNEICYHIQANIFYSEKISENMRNTATNYNYWIKKSDFIPIQYSIVYTMVLQNDTTYQYEKNILTKYELNQLKDESLFTLKTIPDYYKIKDYVPANKIRLLPNETIAPDWQLVSLKDEKINLQGLRGKLVLVDFFTKSCYPCILALPGLQALHEKYKMKGLSIIGINIYDKKEDGIISFLSKHGVTYPVLLGGKEVGESYNVSGIPTVYLINKNGKIIFSFDGYEKKKEQELEDIIKHNL